ncbi:MAG: late secretory pathway protein avl9 [Trizodia sp. TS-e1964]|nr:MAG: late secretory pathway protein avl9 [Trizodia sp. TS-e1964]
MRGEGPEVETWIGVEEGHDPAVVNDWSLLPFMALSDGAHAYVLRHSIHIYHAVKIWLTLAMDRLRSTEDYSYFTLRLEATLTQRARSLFGMSCTRQMESKELKILPVDVTRSTVQKAMVVITDSPQYFGTIRERLSVVTKAWFAQRDFTDIEIIKKFQESLVDSLKDSSDEKDQYLGLSLRELLHEFKYQTLVLFKCCLLQPKMLFFGSRCEKLCMMQFSLISLIPGLIRNLQDCADPEFNSYEEYYVMPKSLKTSERGSLLAYMGLPLQIFGKGSLFGPYTPLQQLDTLADYETKSYVVGSTNPLLLQQRDRYSDILINLDDSTVAITSSSLRSALALSVADRRFIDFLTQSVNDTWDEGNPNRPNTMGYVGSEEFIRLQFEEYILALVSSVKYHVQIEKSADNPKLLLSDIDGDPSTDFGHDWVESWMRTDNFRIFHKFSDSHIFDIVEPRHPFAGGLTVEDIQRRISQQVSDLHLDERFNTGKEAIGKHLASGHKKVSSAFNNLWADIEVMREAQRKRYEDRRAAHAASTALPVSPDKKGTGVAGSARGADLVTAQATVAAAGTRASAYLSSWASWAGEKRKSGWSRSSSASSEHAPSQRAILGSEQLDEGSESTAVLSGPRNRSFEEPIFEAEDHKETLKHVATYNVEPEVIGSEPLRRVSLMGEERRLKRSSQRIRKVHGGSLALDHDSSIPEDTPVGVDAIPSSATSSSSTAVGTITPVKVAEPPTDQNI